MKINFGALSASNSSRGRLTRTAGIEQPAGPSPSKQLQVREKFQDFVGSTFYKEMLKALRSGQKHSKYFYGGQAEEIFRGQMDQQISEDLAHSHAQHLAEPLFEAYARQSMSQGAEPARVAPRSEGAHALDAVA